MKERHLVLFKQVQNALVVLLDDGIFAANHFCEVQA